MVSVLRRRSDIEHDQREIVLLPRRVRAEAVDVLSELAHELIRRQCRTLRKFVPPAGGVQVAGSLLPQVAVVKSSL